MPFPQEIIDFPVMEDISASDAELIDLYQEAIKNQDMSAAAMILQQIPNYSNKIITAIYLNSISTTVNALEYYYLEKFSPAIVVSATQPVLQDKNDMWFEITGTET